MAIEMRWYGVVVIVDLPLILLLCLNFTLILGINIESFGKNKDVFQGS